jgi:hypothetical protein
LGKSFNIRLVSVDVPVKLGDLTCLKLNLLVKVNLLLSDNVELGDLVIDDILSLFQGSVDLVDLLLNFFDLLLGLLNHLVTVLDLVLEVVDELLLLGLLEVVGEVVSSLGHQLLLLLADGLELLEEIVDLSEILLGLLALVSHISNEQLELGCPLVVAMLDLTHE